MPDLIRLEYRNVTMRFAQRRRPSLTAVQGVSIAVARRRGGVADRAERLRQVDLAQHRLGADRAERGRRPSSTASASKGPNAHVAFMLQKDLLLPWRTVVENVMFGVEIQGVAAGRAQAARAGAAGKPQARRILRALSASTVRRHAAARGAGAHARGRSVGAAARRAVLGGRRADPHGAAARAGADAQARRQDRAADHPRPAGSRDAVRPRAGDEPAARPHHRRDRDRHSRPRRSADAPARTRRSPTTSTG